MISGRLLRLSISSRMVLTGGAAAAAGWTGAGAGWPVAMRVGTPVAIVVGTVGAGMLAVVGCTVAVWAVLPAVICEIRRLVAADDAAAWSVHWSSEDLPGAELADEEPAGMALDGVEVATVGLAVTAEGAALPSPGHSMTKRGPEAPCSIRGLSAATCCPRSNTMRAVPGTG